MTDKDGICEMIMHPWPKATDKIQTTHLLLISPHQDLAEQCASYYKRNGEFLKGFELEGMAKKYLKVNGAWEDHVHMVKRNQAIE